MCVRACVCGSFDWIPCLLCIVCRAVVVVVVVVVLNFHLLMPTNRENGEVFPHREVLLRPDVSGHHNERTGTCVYACGRVSALLIQAPQMKSLNFPLEVHGAMRSKRANRPHGCLITNNIAYPFNDVTSVDVCNNTAAAASVAALWVCVYLNLCVLLGFWSFV